MASRKNVFVKGAREHNLKDISVEIPRDALVVFTGVSGSGKSSLAFGTLYAEAQRRYLESVSPYARRLFHQMTTPDVDEIEGLPPAVALQQQRGTPTSRSSVGSITTISHLLRILFSRAGDYPAKVDIIYAEGFSYNNPAGACPHCQGLGRIYDATEESMVPNPDLSIDERAIAAWPPAWHGQNLKDMLVTLGFDIHRPWKKLSKKDRDWILFTEEQPVVPVFAGFDAKEVKLALKSKMEPSYHGNFTSARKYVLTTFRATQSSLMKRRVSQYLVSALCPECAGKRLKRESLSVKFGGLDIAEMGELPLKQLRELLHANQEKNLAAKTLITDINERLGIVMDLGLGHLSLSRSTPTLSPGELQRLRLATQVYSHLFGVVYVLDEPSAGLHPRDTEALLRTFEKLKAQGNSIFVVEHELEIIKEADWIVDVGPLAGEKGGEILYSGPREGLREIKNSETKKYLFHEKFLPLPERKKPQGHLHLTELSRNNLDQLEVKIPTGIMTAVTGISGSGKSTLVAQMLVELMGKELKLTGEEKKEELDLEEVTVKTEGGRILSGGENFKRLVVVDQRPIGRTPRSNLATYTGLFDHVRKLFAGTKLAKQRRYGAGRFSFNVAQGRCENCEGEGFVMVELLFLPSVYSPCPVCQGSRFNEKTLEVKYQGKNIAEVLKFTVDEAKEFFQDEESLVRSLRVLQEVGLGYLRLGQPATELSGGEAQRIKLATELQKLSKGDTLYILDEPTTGLHPSDVQKLIIQLRKIVEKQNTVVIVEHDMSVIAHCDWVIDMGPGAGSDGGMVVAEGTPEAVAHKKISITGQYLKAYLQEHLKEKAG